MEKRRKRIAVLEVEIDGLHFHTAITRIGNGERVIARGFPRHACFINRIIAAGSKHQKRPDHNQCPPELHHPTSSVSPRSSGFHDVTAPQSRRAKEKGGRSLPFIFVPAGLLRSLRGFYVPCGAFTFPAGLAAHPPARHRSACW